MKHWRYDPEVWILKGGLSGDVKKRQKDCRKKMSNHCCRSREQEK